MSPVSASLRVRRTRCARLTVPLRPFDVDGVCERDSGKRARELHFGEDVAGGERGAEAG